MSAAAPPGGNMAGGAPATASSATQSEARSSSGAGPRPRRSFTSSRARADPARSSERGDRPGSFAAMCLCLRNAFQVLEVHRLLAVPQSELLGLDHDARQFRTVEAEG